MKIVEAHMTCIAAPVQWEGRLDDGRTFYLRERHDVARLDVPFGTTVRQVDDIAPEDLPYTIHDFVKMFPELEIAPDAELHTAEEYMDEYDRLMDEAEDRFRSRGPRG